MKRFTELTAPEVNDLFSSAQDIAKVIQKVYKAESLTITLQDGPMAGQTVPHVHVHVIPRHVNDWMNNDDIYRDINTASKQMVDSLRNPRSLDIMANEASSLARFFPAPYENIWSV